MNRIKMSPAQKSAIECRPSEDFVTDGDYLILVPGVAGELMDACNAEGDYAEYVTTDAELKKMARRASNSLAALHSKAIRAAA